jgi:hypothetical protein
VTNDFSFYFENMATGARNERYKSCKLKPSLAFSCTATGEFIFPAASLQLVEPDGTSDEIETNLEE